MTASLLERGPDVSLTETPQLTLLTYNNPDQTLSVLDELDKPTAADVVRILGQGAMALQEEAIAATAEKQEVELPVGMYRPKIVGTETIYFMALRRAAAGRELVTQRGGPIIMRLLTKQ